MFLVPSSNFDTINTQLVLCAWCGRNHLEAHDLTNDGYLDLCFSITKSLIQKDKNQFYFVYFGFIA